MPRGTAARWKRRYEVRLIVPRRDGWRAWGAVRADFERALADPADPAIATAEIASEPRRGADYVRVTLTLTILSTDVADALTIAWDAFRSAARDDLAGWEVTAARAEVTPEPPLIRASWHAPRCSTAFRPQAERAPGLKVKHTNASDVAPAAVDGERVPVAGTSTISVTPALSASDDRVRVCGIPSRYPCLPSPQVTGTFPVSRP